MQKFGIEVRITPRAGLLDPEGNAVLGALRTLHFDEVSEARIGRLIRLEVRAASAEEARRRAEDMCRKLLANPVTEDFAIDVRGS